MKENKSKILLGMSGGTDSSVSAIMLQQQGYEVIGVTFVFYGEDIENIPFVKDARELAGKLGIQHFVLDEREKFEKDVIRYFKDEYLAGRTPFPCTKCNRDVKWKLMFELADRLGCEKVATGHYAEIVEEKGIFYVSKALDEEKDQSFFLWPLIQEQLKRIVLPLGKLKKTEVRKFAAEKGFEKISVKKDSLGACFCEGDYRSFLRSLISNPDAYFKQGDFIDEKGEILGVHRGFPDFTVGQRRGLGIHLNKAVYVKEIRPQENEIVLAPLSSMYLTGILLKECQINDPSAEYEELIVKIRYRKQATPGRFNFTKDGNIKVVLSEALESIAPGQTAVFYRGAKVIGGGFIDRTM